ncbi:Lrp/AsnC family transcriptional regulator [Sphingomonas panni]|uniref:Lrp/AsnC family transcriptional regulator n=1 Tax=Sphingomonas panni TaxID=237612 RepID=UPI001F5BB211|nr:Lrp/AsnC family transcriptional regulator [Sphingomonas panni]
MAIHMSNNPRSDRIDRRILEMLQRDGRITNQALAQSVGLSPSACLARVRRMERDGVITGYRAQVDATRLGACLVVFAELTVGAHDVATTRRLEAALKEMPEAVEAYQVSGSYDFLVRFQVPDMDTWTRLADELADGDLRVITVKTTAVMRVLKAWGGVPL